MMKIPFAKRNFAQEMKPRISGVDLTLDYDNIVSSLAKVGVTCSKLLSKVLYDNVCDNTASSDLDLQAQAKDYLQRAMLHFALYEHFPYLVTRITNDGVTVSKSETKTTVFKYQEDELKTNLISTGWFWMNILIQLLNDHKDDFPDWKPEDSENADIPIALSDFEHWVGVSDEYFFMMAKWLIREVWHECVLSRVKDPKKTEQLARAICYEVMGRACQRLAYMVLPEPIRRDMNNEMGKNHAAQADKRIQESVSIQFLSHSHAYWVQLDVDLQRAAAKELEGASAIIVVPIPPITEDDSFCF